MLAIWACWPNIGLTSFWGDGSEMVQKTRAQRFFTASSAQFHQTSETSIRFPPAAAAFMMNTCIRPNCCRNATELGTRMRYGPLDNHAACRPSGSDSHVQPEWVISVAHERRNVCEWCVDLAWSIWHSREVGGGCNSHAHRSANAHVGSIRPDTLVSIATQCH